MKVIQRGKNVALRFVASTFGGQFIDTLVFVAIAFAGLMPLGALFSIFLSGWLIKVIWEIIALPITLSIVKFLKREENIDVFDYDTNFSPLSLK